MNKSISLLFAYRDRDQSRIFHSMKSLQQQTDPDFQVIFVDYGSSERNSEATRETLSSFPFVEYFYVAHPGLLWNKSKAFNYGIRKSESEYIVTADIDVIFHPEFVENTRRIASTENYTVFSYAYLQKKESKDVSKREFSELKPSHTGYITGSGVYPKVFLEKIHGFDEFYHFYGSEDEDLFLRLEHAGLKRKKEEMNMLAHQWHPRYPFEEKNKLSLIPKINNIRRINMEHYRRTKETGKIIPDKQEKWGECYTKEDLLKLQKPGEIFTPDTRESSVVHFLHELLPKSEGVIEMIFNKNEQDVNIRNLVKRILGKESEPVWSLKQVNDEILKLILFRYREYNYEYKVDEDLRSLSLRIDLNK